MMTKKQPDIEQELARRENKDLIRKINQILKKEGKEEKRLEENDWLGTADVDEYWKHTATKLKKIMNLALAEYVATKDVEGMERILETAVLYTRYSTKIAYMEAVADYEISNLAIGVDMHYYAYGIGSIPDARDIEYDVVSIYNGNEIGTLSLEEILDWCGRYEEWESLINAAREQERSYKEEFPFVTA